MNFASLYVQFDQRILTLDPAAIGHMLNRPAIYQKPWQSRAFISAIIGESLLSAEGGKHRRQRRVADQAFSERNLQTFLPIMFSKSSELTRKWISIVENSDEMMTVIDVANWIHRLTLVSLAVLHIAHHHAIIFLLSRICCDLTSLTNGLNIGCNWRSWLWSNV